jgi:hypothetical protein
MTSAAKEWPKFLTKTCPISGIKKETNGKKAKIDLEKDLPSP